MQSVGHPRAMWGHGHMLGQIPAWGLHLHNPTEPHNALHHPHWAADITGLSRVKDLCTVPLGTQHQDERPWGSAKVLGHC